jgi:hypothetical protein
VRIASAEARATPGPAPSPQQIAGALVVDLDNRRARYDCYRPGCPRPLEGPISAARHGVEELRTFITGAKDVHLAAFHKEIER